MPVNESDEEWRIRRGKRMAEMAKYEDDWPFAYALASLLLIHGDGIELTRIATKRRQRKGRVVMWPDAENRNVGKRMWEAQAGAARHCFDGQTMLYFKFWALIVFND